MRRQRKQITLIVDRQVLLLIGAVATALTVSLIGVSAYAGSQPILRVAGVQEWDGEGAASQAATIADKEFPTEPVSEVESKPTTEPTSKPTVKPVVVNTPKPTEKPEQESSSTESEGVSETKTATSLVTEHEGWTPSSTSQPTPQPSPSHIDE